VNADDCSPDPAGGLWTIVNNLLPSDSRQTPHSHLQRRLDAMLVRQRGLPRDTACSGHCERRGAAPESRGPLDSAPAMKLHLSTSRPKSFRGFDPSSYIGRREAPPTVGSGTGFVGGRRGRGRERLTVRRPRKGSLSRARLSIAVPEARSRKRTRTRSRTRNELWDLRAHGHVAVADHAHVERPRSRQRRTAFPLQCPTRKEVGAGGTSPAYSRSLAGDRQTVSRPFGSA
jgi:hypothetical protein